MDCEEGVEHFCPHCDATLEEQDGFDPALGFWRCERCGVHLYGDAGEVGRFPGVLWYCDECDDPLFTQPGFNDALESWRCARCGCVNRIDVREVLPGRSDDYLVTGGFREMGSLLGRIPPLFESQQVVMLKNMTPDIEFDNDSPEYWRDVAHRLMVLLETGGSDYEGRPNRFGVVCASVLFQLKYGMEGDGAHV